MKFFGGWYLWNVLYLKLRSDNFETTFGILGFVFFCLTVHTKKEFVRSVFGRIRGYQKVVLKLFDP